MEHADPQYISTGLLMIMLGIIVMLAISNTPGA